MSFLFAALLIGQVTLYVAPFPYGSDSNDGLSAAAPFETFDRARVEVQAQLRKKPASITVEFREGTYYLPRPISMSIDDSGVPGRTSILYTNYPNERPVFSGGQHVPSQNWRRVSKELYATSLPANTQPFESIFVNGVRRLHPREGASPFGTYFRVESRVAPTASEPCVAHPLSSGKLACFDRFVYQPADLDVAKWTNLNAPPGDIELIDFEKHDVARMRIRSIDLATRTIVLTGATEYSSSHPDDSGYMPGHRFLIDNVQGELTSPGQFFLDRSSSGSTLYYRPVDESELSEVTIPQQPQLLVATGLHDVTFSGLTFENDDFVLPVKGQTGADEIPAALEFRNSQNIRFTGNTVRQTGGTGLWFITCLDDQSDGCANLTESPGENFGNRVENNAFYDLGGAAVIIGLHGGSPDDDDGNVAHDNLVQNNYVRGYGRFMPGIVAIRQGQGHHNTYAHNQITDGYEGAVHVHYGSSNVPGKAHMPSNNTIAFNEASHLFQGIMNDGGAFYFGVGTPGQQFDPTLPDTPMSGTGNQILNNVAHDLTDASYFDPDGYGGDGLYVDDFTGGVVIENNLVYRVSNAAVSFSGPRPGPGWASVVDNNILAYARRSMFNAYNPYSFGQQPPAPLFFVAFQNLMYFDRDFADQTPFSVQGGCALPDIKPLVGPPSPYPAYTDYEIFEYNQYFNTKKNFLHEPRAFHAQYFISGSNLCPDNDDDDVWFFFSFKRWRNDPAFSLHEDPGSFVMDPGFRDPEHGDFTIPGYPPGSRLPGTGFTVFDYSLAGLSNARLIPPVPPAVPATFPTGEFAPDQF